MSSSTCLSSNCSVFLSFRGKDSRRRSFTDHLYRSEGVSAFMKVDPTESETISAELGKVFEESRLAIVIVSRNYVSSSCYFDELSKIIECKDIREQRAIPVFYQVESSEVKNQTGHVENENNCFQIDRDRVLNWKQTLTDLANIPGLRFKAGPYGFCCYLPRGWFVGQLKKARFIEASISTNRSDVKVKRCGMHIISQQNTSIFAKNLTQTANEYLKLNFRSCQHCKQKVLG